MVDDALDQEVLAAAYEPVGFVVQNVLFAAVANDALGPTAETEKLVGVPV